MFTKALAVTLTATFLLCSCMSEREYQLRAKQLDNQAQHPATYDLFTVEGPLKIEITEGGKAKVTVPGQPFKEITIPDGVRTQADLVKHLVNIGAVTAIGWKSLDNAGGNTTNHTTVNNNAGGTQ